MECNNDEAIQLRDIAELKFAKKDLVGAERFILKSLQLYPCLDFAIQLSAVLHIHIAAQVEVGINELEPYYSGILQVTPLSNDSTIKKQYLKLALLVHPDKNRESMKEESEAAFNLISKALEVLSDEDMGFSMIGSEVKSPQRRSHPTHSGHSQPQLQVLKPLKHPTHSRRRQA